MGRRIPYLAFGLAVAFIFLTQGAWAEKGVTDNLIFIGVERPSGNFSRDEENFGMELVIKHTNDQGGVFGRKLQSSGYAMDAGSKIADGTANAKRLIEEDNIFLLFNHGGSPTVTALAPIVTEKKIPYLFPHEGIYEKKDARYIFTSFPRYESECELIFKYLVQSRGLTKIAIIYADNNYGQVFRDRLKERSSQFGYVVTGSQPVKDMKPADLTAEVMQIKNGAPQAVIMAIYPAQAKKVFEAKAKLDWRNVTMVSAGPLTDEEYLNVPGGYAEGTIGLCYYPDPNSSREPGVVRYRELMNKYFPGKALNRYSLYGYVFGNLTVEGLKRSGRALTREGFIDAMESITNWESGGIMPQVSFSKTDHRAQKAGFIAELRDGKFVPLTGWLVP